MSALFVIPTASFVGITHCSYLRVFTVKYLSIQILITLNLFQNVLRRNLDLLFEKFREKRSVLLPHNPGYEVSGLEVNVSGLIVYHLSCAAKAPVFGVFVQV